MDFLKGKGSNTEALNTQSAGWSNLNNVFNYAMPQSKGLQSTGAGTTATGVNALGSAAGYWQKLLSGSRSAIDASVAPERNMMLSTADASRRQQATMGTARGGGTAATNQTQQDTINANVDQSILSQRAGAADKVAAIGGTEAQVGLGTESEASNLLGLGANSIATESGQATQAAADAAQQQSSLFGDITSGLALGLGMAFA